jgi:putative heme-binding domain-containing protein
MSIYLFISKLVGVTVIATLVMIAWTVLSLSHAPLTTVDLNRGARIFELRCASCHVLDAGQVSFYGPHLGEIGAVAASRVPSRSAEEYLLESIVDPNAYRHPGEQGVMPADVSGGLDAVELTSLVGYLMQHGSSVDWSRLLALTKYAKAANVESHDNIRLEDVEAGKEIYVSKAKCHLCHPLQATPGATLRAPSLLTAGQHSTQHLRESIQHPGRSIVEGYSIWSVWLADGQVASGRLVCSTASTVELVTEQSGETRLVAVRREDILRDDEGNEMLREMPHSMMPDNLTSGLTEQELEQLLAFLKTLK